MKIIDSVLEWMPFVALFVCAIGAVWYHNLYLGLTGLVVVLGLYLSNAFERINALEKRIETLESEKESEEEASVSSNEL